MRHLLALLLFLPCVAADEAAALDVLAGLLDDDDARAAVASRLDALGVRGIPVLDGLLGRVRSEGGRQQVIAMFVGRGQEIRKRALAGERDWLARDMAPRIGKLSSDALWLLRVELGPKGEPVVYFDARTFEDKNRLGMLEYLVCPVRDGGAAKGYECLAGMEEAEWKAFVRAHGARGRVRLRWPGAGGQSTALEGVLPWAVPALGEEGLKLGGNHDESANRGLPADGLAIQVGIVVP